MDSEERDARLLYWRDLPVACVIVVGVYLLIHIVAVGFG